jgi:hypothetical protein
MIHKQMNDFDRIIDSSLQHILGVPVFNNDRLTMHIPLSIGGLGIAVASLSTESSFVSSVGATFNLQPYLSPRAGFIIARSKLI